MATTNPITGDKIQTKSPSKAYSDNFDNIFRKIEPATLGSENVGKKNLVDETNETFLKENGS